MLRRLNADGLLQNSVTRNLTEKLNIFNVRDGMIDVMDVKSRASHCMYRKICVAWREMALNHVSLL